MPHARTRHCPSGVFGIIESAKNECAWQVPGMYPECAALALHAACIQAAILLGNLGVQAGVCKALV